MADSKNLGKDLSSFDNNNNISDSSYNIKALSFEDSQVDHFVPFSSPYILYWHNNKKNLQDITLFHLTNNNKSEASNLSEIERMRCSGYDESSCASLTQILAENTWDTSNSVNTGCKVKKIERNNLSVEAVESSHSKLNEISETSLKNELLTMKENQEVKNFKLTEEMSKNIKATMPLTNEPGKNKPASSQVGISSKKLQILISNQLNTPIGNVLGANNLKFKSNLFNSIDKSVAEEETCCPDKSRKFSNIDEHELSKSPRNFITLSPRSYSTLSIPCLSRPSSTTSSFNQDSTCIESNSQPIPRSPQNSLLTISPNFQRDNPLTHSQIVTNNHSNQEGDVSKVEVARVASCLSGERFESQSSLTLSVPNDLKESLVNNSQNKSSYDDDDDDDDEDDDDFELDEESMKLIDKKLKKLIKKSIEKSKALSKQKQKSPAKNNPLVKEEEEKKISAMKKTVSKSILGRSESNNENIQMKNNVTNEKEAFAHLSSRLEKLSLDQKLGSKFETMDKEKFATLKTLIQNPVRTLVENTRLVNSQNQPKVSPFKSTQCSNTNNNKENSNNNNKASEVSTQTTFLEARKEEQRSRRESPSNSGMKRERIQAMLNLQRQQHERRLQALEKLSRLERLQAEKLKYLMMKSGSEDSILLDSFFQSSNNKTYMNSDGSINVDKVEADWRREKEDDLKNARKFDSLNPNLFRVSAGHSRRHSEKTPRNLTSESELNCQLSVSNSSASTSFSSIRSSKCEVLDLRDLNFGEKLNNVRVVKETRDCNQIRNSPRKNEQFNVSTSWFLPIEPKQKLKNSASEPAFSAKKEAKQVLVKKEADENVQALQNMSLQEAFETFKRDLISRSRRRQVEIQQRAEQRNVELEAKREHAQNWKANGGGGGSSSCSRNRRASLKPGFKAGAQFCADSNNQEVFAHTRRMSIHEIKSQNKRLYEKLPEVQQKKSKHKIDEAKKLNRMRYSIYKKSIQQHVLNKGANFNPNFKAIDDQM